MPAFYETVWSNDLASIICHQFLCLPLLTSDRVLQGFELQKRKATEFDFFAELIKYFEKVWIKREGPVNWCIDRKTVCLYQPLLVVLFPKINTK